MDVYTTKCLLNFKQHPLFTCPNQLTCFNHNISDLMNPISLCHTIPISFNSAATIHPRAFQI